MPAGACTLGAGRFGFAYDNERPRHRAELPAFRIGRTPVTNATWLTFVEGGGYERREWWSDEGWSWKEDYDITHPGGWARGPAGWRQWRIDGWAPLDPDEPVVHVSWFEADAFARAHGARLPSEAEWEKAATWDQRTGRARRYPWGDEPPCAAPRQPRPAGLGPHPAGAHPEGASPCGALGMLGDVWEWTASDFRGYDGFVAHPYREYSEVFFGDRLQGAARRLVGDAASARRPPTFRNWDLPAAAADLLRRAAGVGRVSDRATLRLDRRPRRRRHAAHAARRRARRPHPPVQGAAAQAPLRRLRQRAVRPHHRAARVLPDARRARDPRPRAPARSSRPRGMGELVELGSGTAAKTRVLLDAAHRGRRAAALRPVRRRRERRARVASTRLGEAYPGLELHGIVGDFERHLGEIPDPEPGCPRVLAFLGGTIGNFLPGSRRRFLRELAARLGPDDRLLLGTDLVKDPDVLEAAYDDAAGVTARVQPQRPARSSTASWAPTSRSSASSTSPSTTRSAAGSRCACARAAPAS